MKNNKKGFTLVELLAVIVVLAIVMGIAAVAITNVLDTTKKNAFVASARNYIAGAKTLVNTDQVNVLISGTNGQYAPACPGTNTIALSNIKTENEIEKSPYNQNYDVVNSFVKVTATQNATGDCNYTYQIYLTDGVYAIGTSTSLVAEADLVATKVLTVSGS